MTEIKLFNTLTKEKKPLKPLIEGKPRMYVCGPTVYDRAHLGNARPVVVFDVLNRLLRQVYRAENVTYVRNFTDVDDKINAKAAETGRSIRDITDETISWFHEDMDALGALRPDEEPRATEYISQMVAMIEVLIGEGVAYAAEGHVLFEVAKYEHYGQLSRRNVDDMIAGARVEVAPYKRSPMDFVLWKPSSGDEPGWDEYEINGEVKPIPWGRGRPGWHIECSAMARDILGDKFDIHGGGIDLQFPHHENEIAQSKCACGEDSFAQIWMHNEMLQVDGKKMSKSLGNFFTVRDLLNKGYPGEVIRFVLLSTHYSKPMDWTEKKAEAAEKILRRWRTLTVSAKPSELNPHLASALADDLNTPKYFSELFKLEENGDGNSLLYHAQLVGLLSENLGEWFTFGEKPIVEDELALRISEYRWQCKSERDFARADAIRSEMAEIGFFFMDHKSESVVGYSRSHMFKDLMNKYINLLRKFDMEAADTLAVKSSRLGLPLSRDGQQHVVGRTDRSLDLSEEISNELSRIALKYGVIK